MNSDVLPFGRELAPTQPGLGSDGRYRMSDVRYEHPNPFWLAERGCMVEYR